MKLLIWAVMEKNSEESYLKILVRTFSSQSIYFKRFGNISGQNDIFSGTMYFVRSIHIFKNGIMYFTKYLLILY